MSTLQKIIKAAATVFAIFLALSIIGGIVTGLFFLFSTGNRYSNRSNAYESEIQTNTDVSNNNSGGSDKMNYNTYDFTQSYSNISKISIDSTIQDIIFTTGSDFNVNMLDVSSYCKAEVNNNILTIKDYSHNNGRSLFTWLGDLLDGRGTDVFKGGTITITIPENFSLDDCDIDTGTGKLEMNGLNSRKLTIDAGTGSISANGLTADYLNLDCGTGSLNLKDVDLNGMDLDAGTGSISITGKLHGITSIDCGVGSVYLGLADPKDSYHLDIEKGLGGVTVDDSSYSSLSASSPNAENSLTIEGGVGSITIDFAKQF